MKELADRYIQFLLEFKMKEISELYIDEINAKGNSSLEEEFNGEMLVELKIKDFLLDILNNRPLTQIAISLDQLNKSKLLNTQELQHIFLDQLFNSYTILMAILESYVYEYVQETDEEYILTNFLEGLKDKIENRLLDLINKNSSAA